MIDACTHPKEARYTHEDYEWQVCRLCGAWRPAVDEDWIAIVIGPWFNWRPGPIPGDPPIPKATK